MTYTATIDSNFVVQVLKDNVIYDRVGPWADQNSAQNFIDIHLHDYDEADISRTNGQDLVNQFVSLLIPKLTKYGILNSEINEIINSILTTLQIPVTSKTPIA